jgi:hypothetical protein
MKPDFKVKEKNEFFILNLRNELMFLFHYFSFVGLWLGYKLDFKVKNRERGKEKEDFFYLYIGMN